MYVIVETDGKNNSNNKVERTLRTDDDGNSSLVMGTHRWSNHFKTGNTKEHSSHKKYRSKLKGVIFTYYSICIT